MPSICQGANISTAYAARRELQVLWGGGVSSVVRAGPDWGDLGIFPLAYAAGWRIGWVWDCEFRDLLRAWWEQDAVVRSGSCRPPVVVLLTALSQHFEYSSG
ncbi:MAG: hypothetical protein ACKON9_21340 [Planctomycetaceae bacterium]